MTSLVTFTNYSVHDFVLGERLLRRAARRLCRDGVLGRLGDGVEGGHCGRRAAAAEGCAGHRLEGWLGSV